MNSVSPSAVQYVGGVGVVCQDDTLQREETKRPQQPQLVDPGGGSGFGKRQGTDVGGGGTRDATTAGEPDEVDKLKTKLMSAWNNVKYGQSVGSFELFSIRRIVLYSCLTSDKHNFQFFYTVGLTMAFYFLKK